MAIEGTKGPGLTQEELAEAVAHVSTPDRLSTPFGEFDFCDGVPKPESVQSIFDGLDLVRGITAFMNTIPGASLVAFRNGLRTADGRLGTPTAVIADAHAAGLTVHGWTFRAENQFLPVDFRSSADPAASGDLDGEIRAFVAAGMDGVFSDHPGIAAVTIDTVTLAG